MFCFIKSLTIVVMSCYLHLTVMWILLLGKTALGRFKENLKSEFITRCNLIEMTTTAEGSL